MDDRTENFLSHHGVLGMHWGQRKQEPATIPRQRARAEQNSLNTKRKAIVGGLGLAAAGIGAAFLSKRLKVKIPLSKLSPESVQKGKNAIKRLMNRKVKASPKAAPKTTLRTHEQNLIKKDHRNDLVMRILNNSNLSAEEALSRVNKIYRAAN